MPSPVPNRTILQLCASLVLLSPSSACAGAEPSNPTRAETVGPGIAGGTLPTPAALSAQAAPPMTPTTPPTQAAFMTEGSATVVGYDTFGPEGSLAHRTTFTPRPAADFGRAAGETVWVGRHETFGPEGGRSVTITSSLDCPGLIYVLEQMSALEPGRFNLFGISRRPQGLGPQSRDAHTFRFFGPGYGADDSHTRLSVEGASGDIGALGRVADLQLQACWVPE